MNQTMIEKEQIGNVLFFNNDVLDNEILRNERMDKLKKAMVLGNGEHGKVRITFKTQSGELLTVYTTIWAVGNDFINIKANRTIPVKAIVDVSI